MKIGFIGDVHLNAARKHSQYNGINVYDTVFYALDQSIELINADHIFFLGDIFDRANHFEREVLDFIQWF